MELNVNLWAPDITVGLAEKVDDSSKALVLLLPLLVAETVAELLAVMGVELLEDQNDLM